LPSPNSTNEIGGQIPGIVPITAKGVSLKLAHGYSIQHYVIKYVSDMRYVGGFHRVLLLPPPINLTAAI
jgi:hypothetical protein